MMDNNKSIDDLLKKARAMERDQQKSADKAEKIRTGEAAPPIGQIIQELGSFTRTMRAIRNTYTSVKNTCMGIYNKFLQPVGHAVGVVVGPIYRGYKWAWEKSDHKIYKEKWDPIIASRTGASYWLAKTTGMTQQTAARIARGILLATTIGLGIQCIPDMLGGNMIRYATTEPAYDATRMALFYHNKETVFLNYKQETDTKHDLWSVSGCTTTTDCKTEDAVYYRLKPSLVHNVWSFLNKGIKEPLFLPDQVVAPIAPGISKCEVTSYGERWRVSRMAQAYPYMLAAKCTSLNMDESFKAAAQKGVLAQQQLPAQPALSAPQPR